MSVEVWWLMCAILQVVDWGVASTIPTIHRNECHYVSPRLARVTRAHETRAHAE